MSNFFRTYIGLFSSLVIVSTSWGHWDGPATEIGEYRLTLNTVKPTAFDDNAPLGIFEEANPDVEIHTFAQAETHDGADYVSEVFEDQPLGNVIGFGELIYWHLDCVPSEDLMLTMDVLDLDKFPAKELKDVLTALGNVAQQGQLVATGSTLLPLIADMVKGNDRFRQWNSSGFSIGDDSGTRNIALAAPGPGAFTAPVGLDQGDYEFSFTAQYTEHFVECTPSNLTTLASEIATADAAIKRVVDQLVGEAAKEGEKATSEPTDPVDDPTTSPHKDVRTLQRIFRALDQFESNIGASVNLNADEILLALPPELAGFNSRRFFLLGAAAAAVRRGTVILNDTLSVCRADAQRVRRAIHGQANNGNPDGVALLNALSCTDIIPAMPHPPPSA